MMKIRYFVLVVWFQFVCASEVPKISIITSLYKGGGFINGFLENITKQTIFHKCELIIIDANSPEKEDVVIKQYMKKYRNIIYKRLDRLVGIYEAWNIAILMSRGQYITNANVDDRLSNKCYLAHSQMLDKSLDVDLVYSDSYVTRSPNPKFEKQANVKVINKPEFSKEIMKTNCLPTFNPMWRKSVHEKYGLFDENLKIIGDSELWIRIVKNGSNFKRVPGIYGIYYHNPKGLSTDKKRKSTIVKEWDYIKNKHRDFFN